jgi:poly(3-hydroxybutyrate) depolymerase
MDNDAADGSAAESARFREVGPTCVFAARSDPRFSYCLYVPPVPARSRTALDLVVAVHGSARFFTHYRDAFSAFCRWNDCIVLCPLFPAGVKGDRNPHGYKYLREGEIRYDAVLLSMIDEVREHYQLAEECFALFGYSGGAHFAHRFFMLHARRLWALSIGAPGGVTLLDPSRDWWVGMRNFRDLFGAEPDVAAMRRVPVQMIIGSADLETWEITQSEGGPYWMEGANDAGRTRLDRLQRLRQSYEGAGISVRFHVLRNVAHDALRCIPAAEEFFAQMLAHKRQG